MQMTQKASFERAIGYNLNKQLDSRNMSAQDMAALLSCPEIHVLAILTESIPVDEEEIDKIAKCLNVEKKELTKEADDEILNYNVHYMGYPTDAKAAAEMLDKVDLYVRFLNSDLED